MSIDRQNNYPLISSQAGSQLAFGLHATKRALVVYEGHRDFLSAPRPFVILSVLFYSEPLLCSGAQWLTDVQWSALQRHEHGLFHLVGSDIPRSKEEHHWICHSPELTLEFCASEVVIRETLYHHQSVFSALAHALCSDA